VSELLTSVPRGLRAFVSPYVGVVPVLEELMAASDEPRLVRISCETACGEGLIGATLGNTAGMGGAGFSRSEALAAAIGEAVERYSACFVPHERLVEATATELGAAAVPPEDFALFHPHQYARPDFPFVPFTVSSRIRWVEGIELASGRSVWVPADLVYLSDVGGDRPRIAHATSNGLACADTASAATERGLFELLERDAFMITWSNRLSLPRLDHSGDPELEALDERYFAPAGLDYAAIDLSSFHGIPCVLGVVSAPGTGGALGVGAAAGRTIGRAWWKALSESFASRSAGRQLALVRPDRQLSADGSNIASFEDHIQFYSDDRNAARAAFLTASPEVRATRDVPALGSRGDDLVAELVARVERAGSTAVAVDVTSPDVAAAGLRVVKTLAPGLCGLDVAHRARFLGSPRLLDMAKRAKLTDRRLRFEDLNPDPHPFP
jgi:ribosomal protein S12 methylthiotransferase accessory factor